MDWIEFLGNSDIWEESEEINDRRKAKKLRRETKQKSRALERDLRTNCLRGDAERVAELLRARDWSNRELQGALNRAATVDVVRAFAEIVPRFFNEEEGGAAALVCAVRSKRAVAVRALLDGGVQPNNAPRWSLDVQALHVACACGVTEAAAVLLDAGADANARAFGLQPLHLAAHHGHAECVRLLLEKGVDVEAVAEDEWTPLHHAATRGNRDALSALVDAGANVNARTNCGDTPLHLVARQYPFSFINCAINGEIAQSNINFFECAKLLIKQGASVSIINDDEITPFEISLTERCPNIIQCFIDAGADVFFKTSSGDTALHLLVAGYGEKDNIENLIKLGIDINVVGDEGRTALYRAIDCWELRAAETLIGLGADLSISDNQGLTPLHRAANIGNTDAVDLLVKAGADMTALTNNGESPLHLGAYGASGVVEMLVKAGMDVNNRTSDGRTAVHYAAETWSTECLEKLLELGADLQAVDDRGWTALHVSVYAGQGDVARWLVDHGLSLNARSLDGKTPLHVAAVRGDSWVTRTLLSLRAPVRAVDGQGRTCLHVAARGTDEETVRALLEGGADRMARDANGDIPAMLAHRPELRRILQRWAIAA